MFLSYVVKCLSKIHKGSCLRVRLSVHFIIETHGYVSHLLFVLSCGARGLNQSHWACKASALGLSYLSSPWIPSYQMNLYSDYF